MASPAKSKSTAGKSGTEAVAQHLNKIVCGSYVLFAKTQGYHWNVVGPQFYSLHAMFEVQYNDLFAAIDLLAERIRALGAKAPYSLGEMLKHSNVSEIGKIPNATDMVKDLAKANELLVEDLKSGIEAAEAAGDDATADLLTGRLEVHGKAIWMLRATLEG